MQHFEKAFVEISANFSNSFLKNLVFLEQGKIPSFKAIIH